MTKGNSEETKQKLDRLMGKGAPAPSAKDLEKYVASFQFETIDLSATTYIKDGLLWVSAAGHGDFELEPAGGDTFTVKGLPGQKVQFEMQDGKVVGLVNTQPGGVYKAKVRK